MKLILQFAFALPWLVVAGLSWLVYLLTRQHGRALLAQDALRDRLSAIERHLQDMSARLDQGSTALAASRSTAALPSLPVAPAPPGLSVGSQAPDFALPGLDDRQRTLRDFLGLPRLIVFFNLQCGYCVQMAPRLGQLPDDGPRVLLVGRGDPAEYHRLAAEHGWTCDVVLDADDRTATAYQAYGTPMGYLLDPMGLTNSPLTGGAEALLALLSPATDFPPRQSGLTIERLRQKEQAAAEKAKAAGLAVKDIAESRLKRQGLDAGTIAPAFTLPDLEGATHSLASFRGRRVLLVFSDPQCGPCQSLVPDLVRLHGQHQGNNLRVVMISRGDLEANRAKAAEHSPPFPVLLQKHWEISREYGMFATPIAYLVDEQGVIAKDVAVGADAILQLV